MTFLIAHVGHWAVNLLYMLPLVIAVSVLGYQSLRDRRRGGPSERSDPPAPIDAPPPA